VWVKLGEQWKLRSSRLRRASNVGEERRQPRRLSRAVAPSLSVGLRDLFSAQVIPVVACNHSHDEGDGLLTALRVHAVVSTISSDGRSRARFVLAQFRKTLASAWGPCRVVKGLGPGILVKPGWACHRFP